MVIFLGESGAGKTSLQKELVGVFDTRFSKLVTYTTRPPRETEVNGIDYYFVSEGEFQNLKNQGKFIETTTYRGWQYGSPFPQSDNAVAVLTPSGLRAVKRAGIDTISFYLKVDRRSRMIKLLNRGDDIDEIYRRSLSDSGQFDGIEAEVDFVINNERYRKDLFEIVDAVLKGVADKNKGRW